MATRRYDLDWLRVFTIGGVFLLHCSCFFAVNNYYFANTTTHVAFLVSSTFFLLWVMPMLFVVSGMITYYLLKSISAKELIRQRFFRLIIPFLFGVIVIAPSLVYLKEKTLGIVSGSFADFYLYQYFHGVFGFGGNFAIFGLYLWYLLYLFVFTGLTLIIARWFVPKDLRRRMEPYLCFLERPGAIFLLSIPIIVTSYVSILDPNLIGRTTNGGWGIIPYVIFFFYGVLFAYNTRFDIVLQRHWKVAAVSAGILAILYGWTIVDIQLWNTLNPWLKCALVGSAGFSIIILMLGFFHAVVRQGSSLVNRMNESVLPFYILHFPVLAFVVYYVTRLQYDVFVEFIISALISLVIILFLCVFVSRVNLLRLLFGMKRKKSS